MACVKLSHVSKRYRVYDSPLRSLVGMVAPKMVVPREVWALQGIDLSVEAGECVGIIGNNGSGKSTLLSVVGGVVAPTEGTVEVAGRVSTLLDLTVGMQKDLSGRENIGIIGSLLGMSEPEVRDRELSIIHFADLGDAIERPVKTYSSGMRLRLGFAIGLHVDFEVFLVDEVLAVGDVNFHAKCIHRLRDLHINQKKTILIASHGLGDIAALTTRLLLLASGRILHQGRTEDVLAAYWQECERERNRVGRRYDPLKGANPYGGDRGTLRIEAVRFLDAEGQATETYATGAALAIEVWFDAKQAVDNPLFRVQIFRSDGVWVHGMNSYRHDCNVGRVEGRGCMRLEYERLNLLEGDYYVSIGVWPDEYSSFVSDVAFDVREKAYVIRVRSDRSHGGGIVAQPARWHFLAPGAEETRERLAVLEARGALSAAPTPAAPAAAGGDGRPPDA